MNFTWRCSHERLAIALLTIFVSIAFLILNYSTDILREKQIWAHICIIQALSGFVLLAGSIWKNHWLFLPWIVSAIGFIYILLYTSYISYWESKMKLEPIFYVSLFHITAVFWCYFAYAIIQDFLYLRRLDIEYIISSV